MPHVSKLLLVFAFIGCVLCTTLLVVSENTVKDDVTFTSKTTSETQMLLKSDSVKKNIKQDLHSFKESFQQENSIDIDNFDGKPSIQTNLQVVNSIASPSLVRSVENVNSFQKDRGSNSQKLIQAAASSIWGKVITRFPEFGLSQPPNEIVRYAKSHSELKTAISAAIDNVGDDLIVLQADSAAAQIWENTASIEINCPASKGKIAIVAMNSDGTFSKPIIFDGFGIFTGKENKVPVYIANISIRNATTFTSTFQKGAISSYSSDENSSITLSCVTIANSGNANSYGGLVAYYGKINAYNTTIDGCVPGFGAGAYVYAGTLNLQNCTITNNGGKDAEKSTGTLTLKNCILSTEATATSMTGTIFDASGLADISWADPTKIGHRAFLSSASNGIGIADSPLPLTSDALGNARPNGTPDCGAVEFYGDVVVTAPTDFVALPSGMKQNYLGWTDVSVVAGIVVEYSLTGTDGTWQKIPESDLVLSDSPNEFGWRSARHVHLTAGTQYFYRVGFYEKDESEAVYTEVKSATTVPASAVPQLASRPGANKTIFLNFSTYVFEDLLKSIRAGAAKFANAKYAVLPNYVHYGNDVGGGKTISTADAIKKIYQMVAEDWAIFDVNVTTIEPDYEDLIKTDADDEKYGIRALFGMLGKKMTSDATVDDFVAWGSTGESTFNTFSSAKDNIVIISGNIWMFQNAATATHEISHTFALTHDGGPVLQTSNDDTTEYYTGGRIVASTGTVTTTTWFPVMGATPSGLSSGSTSFDADDFMNQWSHGDYTGAFDAYRNKNGVPEDDIAVLLGLWKDRIYPGSESLGYGDHGLRLIEDDFGDTIETARNLNAADWTNKIVTCNGIIGKHEDAANATVTDDVDVFALRTNSAGTVSVKVFTATKIDENGILSVATDGTGSYKGVSLNTGVDILDASGNLLESSALPTNLSASSGNFRDAELSFSLPAAGIYYVRVKGVAEATGEYTEASAGFLEYTNEVNDSTAYGSIGLYAVTISLVGTTPSDVGSLTAKFETWSTTKGLTGTDAGLDATPANDGIANLEKFVFDSAGMLAPTKPAGAFGTTRIFSDAGVDFLQIEFPYNSNAEDVTLSAERFDGTTWSSTGTLVTRDAANKKIFVKLTTPISATTPKQAVRLKGTLGGKTFTTEVYGYQKVSCSSNATTKFAIGVHNPIIYQKMMSPIYNGDDFTIEDENIVEKLSTDSAYIVELLKENQGDLISIPFIVNRSKWRNFSHISMNGTTGVVFTDAKLCAYINNNLIKGYRIRKALTVNDLFNNATLKQGTSRTADIIKFHILEKNLWSFWKKDNVWQAGSIRGEGVVVANAPIFYQRPISLIRREDGEVSLILTGEVLVDTQSVEVFKSDGNVTSGLLFEDTNIFESNGVHLTDENIPLTNGRIEINSKIKNN